MALNDADKRRLRDLTHRQDTLKERLKTARKLESLFQLSFALDPKIVQNIGEAEPPWGVPRTVSAARFPKLCPARCLGQLSQSQQQCNRGKQLARAVRWAICRWRFFRGGRFLPTGRTPLPGICDFRVRRPGGLLAGTEKFRLPGKKVQSAAQFPGRNLNRSSRAFANERPDRALLQKPLRVIL
jgi:hypothetical protein